MLKVVVIAGAVIFAVFGAFFLGVGVPGFADFGDDFYRNLIVFGAVFIVQAILLAAMGVLFFRLQGRRQSDGRFRTANLGFCVVSVSVSAVGVGLLYFLSTDGMAASWVVPFVVSAWPPLQIGYLNRVTMKNLDGVTARPAYTDTFCHLNQRERSGRRKLQ